MTDEFMQLVVAKFLTKIVRIEKCREKMWRANFLLQNIAKGDNNNIFKALWNLNTIPRATFLSWR